MENPIQLDSEQIAILGRPNFSCMRVANRLIDIGLYAAKPKEHKSEYEQAITIHFLFGLYEKYGDEWSKEANKILFKEPIT